MIVKVHVIDILSVLVLLLVKQSQTRTIEISAYGNYSSYSNSALRNSSSSGIGRAMSEDRYQNSLDEYFSKPITIYQDPLKPPEYIYPTNSEYVNSSNAVATDRFAPGEAYGGTVYKIVKARENKLKYGYQDPTLNAVGKRSTAAPPAVTAPATSAPTVQFTPPPLIFVPTPNPPITFPPTPAPATTPAPAPAPVPNPSPSPPAAPFGINLFAPNIHSHYPQPAIRDAQFQGMSSYNAPPSGATDDQSSVDTGPQPVDSPDANPSIQAAPSPPNQYIPPDSLFQFPPNIHSHYLPPPPKDNTQTTGISSYLPPPAGPSDAYLPPPAADSQPAAPPNPSPYSAYLPPQPAPSPPMAMPEMPPQMPMDMPPQMPMDMPPQMMMGMPPAPMGPYLPMNFDFHGFYPHDHFPEYFDHDHDHDDPTTTMAPAPPPPPPPQKHLRNSSYYRVTQFLWYIPIYFSLYMVFYALVLMLRSIARHKVNYPNVWNSNGRSLDSMLYLTNDQAVDKAEMMANFVMEQICDFKEKYL
ncbi:uncharacterized protein LOC134212927 [Armigeres subalbatus]|uniref:uncharacterized protein LOC134212927 n=1 Tax=Armigeres subalbatus TaxID=124917 RepID=UPI002ED0652C